jgi:hypothetical protein
MSNIQGGTLEEVHIGDSIKAEQQAYKAAARTPIAQIAEWLIDNVGQRLTATGLGLKDARPVRAWIQGGEIKDENEDRLRMLYRLALTVALIYDAQTARAFLRSASPYLNDTAPVLAVAEGNDRAALEALRAFLEG